MPSGKAAAIREAVAKENRADLQLERTPWGKTGFVNVVEVKGKYQARLQVPGDGRGGSVKRKQHPLPGLFDTAEEQAQPPASLLTQLSRAPSPIAGAAGKGAADGAVPPPAMLPPTI